MRLTHVILRNFRGYQQEIRIDINKLTAFIGQNDAGKSSILDALDIFFNAKQRGITQDDSCIFGNRSDVCIGCVFSDLDHHVILDASARTKLAQEYLLNSDGNLEIHKCWDFSGDRMKQAVFAHALHPSTDETKDLLQVKILDLRRRAQELHVDENSYDARISGSIRDAIRRHVGELQLQPTSVPLKDADAKDIWATLERCLPSYHLFKSDRSSTDADAEVQDPMRVAVGTAIHQLENVLDQVKDQVRDHVTTVANRTIRKLSEMAPEVARALTPRFEEPKWHNLFKVSLVDEHEIPVNKKGSGTRRLILINFFRAEAERAAEHRIDELGFPPGIIYAVEEPETSQHPDNQRRLIEALQELSEARGAQVLLTTHVPGLAGLLPTESIRYVTRFRGGARVLAGPDILPEVAESLGVLPDARRTEGIKLVVLVEGPHDVNFLCSVSSILHAAHPELPDLSASTSMIILPVGGQTLKDWIFKRYLLNLRTPEVHIYDRGSGNPPKYQDAAEEVNRRGDRSIAFITRKREIENYLHPAVIQQLRNIEVDIRDDTDVPDAVARHLHEGSGSPGAWEELDEDKRKEKKRRAKRWLNDDAVKAMSVEQIVEADTYGEIFSWLEAIGERL